ncbi:hypothetical protein KZ829_13140 [Actinoplanes hulinensis]|uniref:HEAT repeat domain-containing protein n=1 Tax=Actinoplanes hulinensis TaxID=1144547 RepID=A0ABS7B0W4_9ACTN|nr:hypothetical protein [Actinoplanes hulinensis]MBW6434681.1 hypothetical protein [Actinoplanes hulinensis]
MIEATRELLAVLEPLPYRKRLHHVAAWARTAPERAAVCADLRSGGQYERHLALIAAMSSGDLAAIDEFAGDPVPALRAVALDAALRTGTLAGRIADLTAVDRRRLYRRVRRLRRPDLADRLIRDVLTHHGPREAAAVLPACGADTVRELLPTLEHLVNMAALARRHPTPVHERFRERLAAAEPAQRTWIWYEAAQPILDGDPEVALDLLERYGPEDSLPSARHAYARLALIDPERVTALLSTPGRRAWLLRTPLRPSLLRRLAVLPDERLMPFARLIRDRSLPDLLAALPPARRGAVYDAALADVDTGKRVPVVREMEVLPAAIRIREARRILALPVIRDDEAQVLTWSSFLDFPAASAALESAIRAGDAGVRARGYALLVAAALRTRDPGTVAEVTARLRWLRNEHDPVRTAALTALVGAARLLTPAAVDDLTRIATDAIEARDASPAGIGALGRLAAGVLHHHFDEPELVEWAVATVERTSTVWSVPSPHRLDLLRRGQEAMVFARLRPFVAAASARGSHRPLLALTAALGDRAHDLQDLQDMLRTAIADTPEAVGYWLDDRRTRGERVAEVLAIDPETARLPIVWQTVCAHRTDLLDTVLDAMEPYRVPAGAPHPERWLPRQQRRFVDLMERVVDAPDVPPRERAGALRAAARVPEVGRELVRRHLDSPDVVLAEAALGALIWTDRPDLALPDLLAHAGGERARAALYAAARAVGHIPPSRLPGLLNTVLTGPAKVTSRKEAVRLLGRYGPPGAMGTLLEAYRLDGQHRDVRAAIVSTARRHLDVEESWAIIEAAAGGSREEYEAVLGAIPARVPVEYRPRYAALIVAACDASDREIRRAAYGELPRWAPWSGDLTEMLVDRITDLDEILDGDEAAWLMTHAGAGWLDSAFDRLAAQDAAEGGLDRLVVRDAAEGALDRLGARDAAGGVLGRPVARDAAGGVLGRPVARDAAGGVLGRPVARDAAGGVLGRPLARDAAGSGVLSPRADRPARRRIELIVRAATRRGSGVGRVELIPEIRRLAGRPGYLRLALTALVELGRLDNLDEIADRCAGRPVVAVDVAQRVGARLRQLPELIDAEFLAPLISGLTARGDLPGGLIALSLARIGATFGWGRPWHDLLLALRAHPDPEVSDSAYEIDMG